MNAKTIVRFFLLGIVFVGLALVGYQQFDVTSAQTLTKLSNVDKTAPKLKDGVSDNIKLAIGEKSCITQQGEVIASWDSQVKRSIDKDELEDRYPEIYKELLQEKTIRVLRIKPKKIQ